MQSNSISEAKCSPFMYIRTQTEDATETGESGAIFQDSKMAFSVRYSDSERAVCSARASDAADDN